MGRDAQLSLFSPAELPTVPAVEHGAEVRTLGERLPANILMGTCSWSFPGWQGIVYGRKAGNSTLANHGLQPYAAHPVLRAVNVDRTYYGPLTQETFAEYAEQVPEGFRFVVKAHELLTLPRFPNHPRYGAKAGEDNPQCLDPEHALRQVIEPTTRGLGDKLGAILFQFVPHDPWYWGGADSFAEKLGTFLAALPRGVPFAVEIRNKELLTPAYGDALRASNVLHAYNVHPTMPSISQQRKVLPVDPGRPQLVRWMLKRGFSYEGAKNRFHPFDRIVDEDPVARRDIAELCEGVGDETIYVMINNKAEGSAPLTAVALAQRIVATRP